MKYLQLVIDRGLVYINKEFIKCINVYALDNSNHDKTRHRVFVYLNTGEEHSFTTSREEALSIPDENSCIVITDEYSVSLIDN